MEIKKPHFYTNLINGDRVSENVITEKDFDLWFNEMLANAVEVCAVAQGNHITGWHSKNKINPEAKITHKALLINIQPIKKKSALETLEEVYRIHGSRFDDALKNRIEELIEDEK